MSEFFSDRESMDVIYYFIDYIYPFLNWCSYLFLNYFLCEDIFIQGINTLILAIVNILLMLKIFEYMIINHSNLSNHDNIENIGGVRANNLSIKAQIKIIILSLMFYPLSLLIFKKLHLWFYHIDICTDLLNFI